MAYDCVHLGLQKCGSTLLQRHIFSRHPQIALLELHKATPHSTSDALTWLSDSLRSLGGSYNYATSRRVLAEAAAEVGAGNKRIVLSEERLSGDIFHGQNFQSNTYILSKLLNEPRILLVVRSPLSYILSSWQQYVNMGGPLSLSDFLSHHSASPAYLSREHSIFNRIQYYRYVEWLQELFVPDKIEVMYLEDLQRDFQAFVESVYRFVGVSVIELDGSQVNSSLGYYESNFLRYINAFCKGYFNQAPVYLLSGQTQRYVVALLERLSKRRKTAREVVPAALPETVRMRTSEGVIRTPPIQLIRRANQKLAALTGRDLEALGWMV